MVVIVARYHCAIVASVWAQEMRRRVAVTGLGIVCPLGANVEEVWASLLDGYSSITPRTFTNAATGTTITIPAAGVPESALDPLSKVELGITDKFGRLALMAARRAISDAKINLLAENCERVGVASGTCMGGITETEVGFDTIFVQKRAKVHPFTVVRTMYNSPAAMVALSYGISGPVLAYSTTCSSSSVAIGEAARQIQHGYADVMIAGGSETLLTYSAVNCWYSAQLLAPIHEDPAQSCRPFDLTRRGTVLGEGSVFVVLEEWEHAIDRQAPIRAELAGYSCTSDCAHITQPSLEGQARPMQGALADAGIDPGEVGYINAHGTATKLNDEVETNAIKLVFGDHSRRLAISSTKSMVGHLVGAAGALGFMICVLAVERKLVPPTANLHRRDPACDLDYIPQKGRESPGLSAAMCNAFGFGGTAASLIAIAPRY